MRHIFVSIVWGPRAVMPIAFWSNVWGPRSAIWTELGPMKDRRISKSFEKPIVAVNVRAGMAYVIGNE